MRYRQLIIDTLKTRFTKKEKQPQGADDMPAWAQAHGKYVR